MALDEIIQKRAVVDTPSATDLAARPDEWANRFQFHVSTHVAIADIAILNDLRVFLFFSILCFTFV